MKQKFTGTVIGLNTPQTAKVELFSIKLVNPKYHARRKFITRKQVHYEVSEKAIINWLIQYFSEHKVKKISSKNGELEISYNNGETNLLKEVVKKHELQNVKDYLTKTQQTSLTAEKMKELGGVSDFSPAELPLQLGDQVVIESCRPRSKTKRFMVVARKNSLK